MRDTPEVFAKQLPPGGTDYIIWPLELGATASLNLLYTGDQGGSENLPL